MFVRIARFEGGTTAEIEAEGARIRHDLEAARRGEAGTEVPSRLSQITSRFEMLVDRERGATAVLVYCETQEQVREVDRIMKEMSPTSDGWGERVSAELYEVYVDEVMDLAQAA